MIDQAYQRTKKLLLTKREALEKIAQALLAQETIFQKDLEKLIGQRPPHQTQAPHVTQEAEVATSL